MQKRLTSKNLTYERLHEILYYDLKTGIWIWLETVNNNNAHKYDIAGSIHSSGYRYISINKKLYSSANLAFLYVKGNFPVNVMDHINRIRHDDRWCNLRHIARQYNNINQGIRKDNKSGVTGVSFRKNLRKWRAMISVSNKKIYLGTFRIKSNAVLARFKAEKKYGFIDYNPISTAYLYLKERSLI